MLKQPRVKQTDEKVIVRTGSLMLGVITAITGVLAITVVKFYHHFFSYNNII